MNLPVGILLAAGKSERFGGNKLLYTLNNKPMLMVAAEKLVRVLPESIVVVSSQLESRVNDLEQLGLRVVVNEHSEHGMGSSIACGVRTSRDSVGWLIMLADMPYLQVATLRQLVSELVAGADIVAPFYQQQRGHPVGFQQHYFEDLVSLDGDMGARQIIDNNLSRLQQVITDDAGVIIDIDSKQDIELNLKR